MTSLLQTTLVFLDNFALSPRTKLRFPHAGISLFSTNNLPRCAPIAFFPYDFRRTRLTKCEDLLRWFRDLLPYCTPNFRQPLGSSIPSSLCLPQRPPKACCFFNVSEHSVLSPVILKPMIIIWAYQSSLEPRPFL